MEAELVKIRLVCGRAMAMWVIGEFPLRLLGNLGRGDCVQANSGGDLRYSRKRLRRGDCAQANAEAICGIRLAPLFVLARGV